MSNKLQNKKNYGVLSDISKSINHALGDSTGRTVSRRTAQGLTNELRLTKMHEDTAEDIVHGGMIATVFLMRSKSENAKLLGLLIGIGLAICYQKGK